MQKKWNVQKIDKEAQVQLAQAIDVDPIVAQLLVNRGIKEAQEARQFLKADLSMIHDPFLFKDMKEAVDRINQAQANKEKVLIFGDYDVDGVTSSVVLNQALIGMGLDVIHTIPHREKDGYGLNHEVAEYAKSEGVTLMITVDCGTTAISEVETIQALGIDVIIVDHHQPLDSHLPNAYAMINPKQKDCSYPFKDLASVGLVSKLVHALIGQLPEDYLDFVAIGTVADIVPLRGENRIFVKAGLPRVNTTKNKGLRALLQLAKVAGKKITPFHVGFILGPRINATGRMDSAHKSLDLFLAKEESDANELVKELEKHNVQRQKLQRNIVQEALDLVEETVNFEEEKIIVLSKEGWHKGVLGIVASRLADKYYRPSIVISLDNGVGTASARSIDGFHLHQALSSCSECLENFGGHQGAAGLTIKEENIDPFRSMINEVATKTIEIKKLDPVLTLDCEISLKSVTMDLANIIDSLEPFGEGNPTPVFCVRNVEVKSYPQVFARETLKFWVCEEGFSISAVGFGMAKFKDMIKPGEKVDLAFEIAIDDWNKAPVAQLRLKDIKES